MPTTTSTSKRPVPPAPHSSGPTVTIVPSGERFRNASHIIAENGDAIISVAGKVVRRVPAGTYETIAVRPPRP